MDVKGGCKKRVDVDVVVIEPEPRDWYLEFIQSGDSSRFASSLFTRPKTGESLRVSRAEGG